MQTGYLDAIRQFEGFTPKAGWDYAQFTNGYGTRAKFAGEVIDKPEADKRFAAEISQARAFVESQVPNADEGTKAALTSLTFNAGGSWSHSGLGDAVRRGDLDTARQLFLQYDKAGGQVLPGLVSRRTQEAMWIGAPGALGSSAVAQAEQSVSGSGQDSMAQLQSIMAASPRSATSARAHVTQPADAVSLIGSARLDDADFSAALLLRTSQPELNATAMLLTHNTLAKLGPRTAEQKDASSS